MAPEQMFDPVDPCLAQVREIAAGLPGTAEKKRLVAELDNNNDE